MFFRKFDLKFFESLHHGEYNISTISIISTDEDPSLRIESSAITNLRDVSTKLKSKFHLINFILPLICIYSEEAAKTSLL